MPAYAAFRRTKRSRGAVRDACLAVAEKYTPSDVTIVFRKRLTGCAWARSRRMSAPRPVTRRALHVYLHELAHILLGHYHEKPVFQQELEAEEWAFAIMNREGIAIPKKSLIRARAYVAMCIAAETSAAPSRPAIRFAAPYIGLYLKHDRAAFNAGMRHADPA